MIIRSCADEDLAAITKIYAQHVLHGTASFETEPPDIDEIARRRGEVMARGLPYLVAEDAGGVAGYAYAAPYRMRPAYRFTVEDSVYVEQARVGEGIGSRLLERVIVEAGEAGARQMIAIIGDSANVASVALHHKFGFRHVGVLRSVGFKFGRWLDTVIMQKDLGLEAPALGRRYPPFNQ